jgi:hypothetical protein
VNVESPQLTLEEMDRTRCAGKDRWRFGWRLRNLTGEAMGVLSARLPHGKFRSEEQEFDPPLEVPPGGFALLELAALCDGSPGTIIENAFVVLLVEWRGGRWRIFARLRVAIDQRAEPHTVTERITTQRVGFSSGV